LASLRVIARVWSVLSLGFLALLLIGQGLPSTASAARAELVSAACLLVICVGLLLAWFRELTGGILTLLGLAGCCYVAHAASGRWPRGLLLTAFPGLLFLASGLARRRLTERYRDR